MPTRRELLPLLSQDESATLEFKKEWYRLEEDGQSKQWHKAELVKDFLTLANGSADTAGETAVMLVGVESERQEDGTRVVHDLGHMTPSPAELLQIVRSLSTPPTDSLEVVPLADNGSDFFADVIPPTPHVYEATRPLKTRTKAFSEFVVLVRRGDSVGIASGRVRELIGTLKAVRLSEIHSPPAAQFRGAVGATTRASLNGQISVRRIGTVEGDIGGGVRGALVGRLRCHDEVLL
jgi:hypothetical protein